MDESARFEQLVRDVSSRFSGVRSEQVDAEVDRALELLIDFLGTDRSTFLELLPDEGSIAITHSRARPGVTPATPSIGVERAFPWYYQRLRRGQALCFERLPEELPASALAERAYVMRLPMLSHVAVPLLVEGEWVCALLTATAETYRSWPDRDVERVRIVGQILATAIYRRRLESELRESLEEVQRLQGRLEAENAYLRESVAGAAGFEEIVGRSSALRAALDLAAQVAPTTTAVLLLGETGTGKELLARAIHSLSPRAERPFIKVNCAALPPTLVESELFGHEKGAFTGATSARPGRFELADGGTLFLDEIGEIPPEIQVKLLRVLQDGEFERVGAIQTRRVDARLVAATNRDLEQEMAAGRFRSDLFYRLSPFPIVLPPLRDRREDIPLLVWDLIHRRQDEIGRRVERVSERSMQALVRYAWPGNVRELANVIERALILSPGPELHLGSFRASIPPNAPNAASAERLDEVERAHFRRILERCQWRISGSGNAAELLGMRPSTLRSRLRKLGVARPGIAPPA